MPLYIFKYVTSAFYLTNFLHKNRGQFQFLRPFKSDLWHIFYVAKTSPNLVTLQKAYID
jgi:hypothetical protein